MILPPIDRERLPSSRRRSRAPFFFFVVCATAGVSFAAPQDPPALPQMTIEWSDALGVDFDSRDFSNVDTDFAIFRATGTPDHAGVYAYAMARVEIGNYDGFKAYVTSEWRNETLRPQGLYDISNSNAVDPDLRFPSAQTIMTQQEFEALVFNAWNPANPKPNRCKKSFVPVLNPAGGATTERDWPGWYHAWNNASNNWWKPIHTEQVSQILIMEAWIKQMITQQTALTANPIDGNQFYNAVGSYAIQFGLRIKVQVVYLWTEDHDPGNFPTEELAAKPGLTGNYLAAGLSEPIEWSYAGGWSNPPTLAYPYLVLDPVNQMAFTPIGSEFCVDIISLLEDSYAILVDDPETTSVQVPLHAKPGGVTKACFIVPPECTPGWWEVKRFISNGTWGPVIPKNHRDRLLTF